MSYVSKFSPGVPMPGSARIGITEEVSALNNVDVRRTVNGDALVVQSPWGRRMMRFHITASGLAIRSDPCLLGIMLGDRVILDSSVYRSFLIPAGAVSVPVGRSVVAGSRVLGERRDSAGVAVPCTYAGETVGVVDGPAAFDVIARCRLSYPVVLVSHNAAAQEIEGTQTWDAVFEECN